VLDGDIDIFIEDIDKNKFDKLVEKIESNYLWIINTSYYFCFITTGYCLSRGHFKQAVMTQP